MSPFLFSFLKKQAYKTKKIININYIIIVLMKIRLLMFLVFSQYGLACKYEIIIQISIYDWMQNYILWYLAQKFPTRQGYNRNLIKCTFLDKRCL